MTAPFVMSNGRHQGVLITRVPVNYLKWMVNSRHSEAQRAIAELERRGTTTPKIDISNHAIDRASLRLATRWRKGRHKNEGLHSWLYRAAEEAWDEKLRRGISAPEVVVDGIKFVFSADGVWPVLKTVMAVNKSGRGRDAQ